MLAGIAAAWMERRVVQAAAVALFAGTLPHTLYHFTTTESYSTADNVLSLGGLVLQTVLPLAILYLASGARQQPAPISASAPPSTTPKEA